MRFLTILATFAALTTAQTPDKPPAPKDSKAPATPSTPTVPADPDSQDPFGQVDPKVHAAAVAKGRAEAEEELKENKARIWTFGLNHSLLVEHLDRESGLYYSSFGCVIDDDIVGRVKGHNARIAESIRDNGVPKNSFKPWDKELFGLAQYFEIRSRTEKPVRLTMNGPSARSPDGKFVVKLVKHDLLHELSEPPAANGEPPAKPDETIKPTPFLLVGEQDVQANWIWFFGEEPELVWGPKDSWFAVLRVKSRTGDVPDFVAVDLRGKREIRHEFGKK
jgi:hypothetical protein